VREKLKQSPYILALFVSPSDDGLKAVFRVRGDVTKLLLSFTGYAEAPNENSTRFLGISREKGIEESFLLGNFLSRRMG
jgi:hypothetical protein